jgi:HlyD family secretion protein
MADATGTFEAKEIIVSAEANGKIVSFPLEEGEDVQSGAIIANIEARAIELQKAQVEATMEAVGLKTAESDPQVKVLEQQKSAAEANIKTLNTQLGVIEKEYQRVQALVASSAATDQQLDEISGKVDILKSQIEAAKKQFDILDAQIASARRTVAIQNRGISSEKKPLARQMDILDYQLSKATITSPIDGTIITKYVEENEFIGVGRPICKLADLSTMELHAYVTGPQLGEIKIGQKVEVLVDQGDGMKSYEGTISKIATNAEFTPKTIQTKDERANLVYAIDIRVINDGFIKTGMYGEVNFQNKLIANEESGN